MSTTKKTTDGATENEEARPAAPAPAKRAQAPAPTEVKPGFLGVLRSKHSTSKAALPVVVKGAGDRILGVVVMESPSFKGRILENELVEAKFTGPFTYHNPSEFDPQTKAMIARLIQENRKEEGLDVRLALASFGYQGDESFVSNKAPQR